MEGGTVSKSQNLVNLKPMQIDVPQFENGDPQGWILKIQQYFDFHNTIKEQRLQIAPLYFDGKALAWYQWLQKKYKDCFLEQFLEFIAGSIWALRARRLSGQIN